MPLGFLINFQGQGLLNPFWNLRQVEGQTLNDDDLAVFLTSLFVTYIIQEAVMCQQ